MTSKNFAQDWALDQLGNWPTFKQDNDGNGTWDLEQERSHNAVNEIGPIIPYGSIVQPQHDAAGNMTTMPSPLDQTQSPGLLVYDAWNRLARIWDDFHVNVALYEYDGLNRRIVRNETGLGGDKRHFYYNERWQVLEERVDVSGTIDPDPVNQYVWHPYYVDALAVRYYDENTDGAGIVRHWYTQDANFNVTAVVNDTGTALERYSYTPYGEVTFLDANFAVGAANGTISAIDNVYLYTGRERDPETGLQLNRHRYYHAGLGRWLTRDPIGYEGSPYNLLQYSASRPNSSVDPSGLRDQNLVGIINEGPIHGLPVRLIEDLIKFGNTRWRFGSRPRYVSLGAYNRIQLPEHFYDNAGNLDCPHLKCLYWGDLYNEIWHAWWDQVLTENDECKWLHERIRKEAGEVWANWLVNSANYEEMAEEAMSETLDLWVWSTCRGQTSTYQSVATAPLHSDPGEDWEGNPFADITMSEEIYDLLMHAMIHGCDKAGKYP